MSIKDRFDSWRRKTLPASQNDAEWRYQSLINHLQHNHKELSSQIELLYRLMFGQVGTTYNAPLWLLAAPDNTSLSMNWGPPNLETPVCQLCTYEQMITPHYAEICREIDIPVDTRRKNWEFVYIFSAMQKYGALRKGSKLLGFGVGTEPLSSAFAKHRTLVTATDAPSEIIAQDGWQSTNQHSSTLAHIHKPNLIDLDSFNERVSFLQVDMNNIPAQLKDYDACWSACALEHLGGIDNGLIFIERSLETLSPGGYAIHTTEFNLSSNDVTLDTKGLCLYRRKDIEHLCGRLIDKGHRVLPLNFYPGGSMIDAHIDTPPFSPHHVKITASNFVTTSIGMIIQKCN